MDKSLTYDGTQMDGPRLDRARMQIESGRNALGYLARVMEGTLPVDTAVLRDLYIQTFQMTCILSSAVVGLEHCLDLAIGSHL